METLLETARREFEAVKADKPPLDTHWSDSTWDWWIKRYNAAFDELWYAQAAEDRATTAAREVARQKRVV